MAPYRQVGNLPSLSAKRGGGRPCRLADRDKEPAPPFGSPARPAIREAVPAQHGAKEKAALTEETARGSAAPYQRAAKPDARSVHQCPCRRCACMHGDGMKNMKNMRNPRAGSPRRDGRHGLKCALRPHLRPDVKVGCVYLLAGRARTHAPKHSKNWKNWKNTQPLTLFPSVRHGSATAIAPAKTAKTAAHAAKATTAPRQMRRSRPRPGRPGIEGLQRLPADVFGVAGRARERSSSMRQRSCRPRHRLSGFFDVRALSE